MEYIAFDAHKHYTLASVARPDGQLVREQRLPHERGALQQFLARCERGSPVAVETIGNWYWIVDEIEAAGCVPKLVHARKAKLMMGAINKTDKLDVRGLNQLQRNGTLPTVWIPDDGRTSTRTSRSPKGGRPRYWPRASPHRPCSALASSTPFDGLLIRRRSSRKGRRPCLEAASGFEPWPSWS